MAKIILDPRSRIRYSSFYIKGLWDVFGKKNVTFDLKPFLDLDRGEKNSYDHYMPIIIENGGNYKIVIDFRDKTSIKENAYNWCDLYAKININFDETNRKFQAKLFSIAPSFGIQLWNTRESIFFALKNMVKSNFQLITSYKNFLADYIRQSQRLPFENYIEIHDKKNNFIFLIATLWNHQNCIEGTNLLRKTFIEVCKNLNINFEGGFFAKQDHPQYELVSEMVFEKKYSLGEYISKTKQSQVVFNTPAVHQCHGWKLGEYLVLGKAIISTPIFNKLPANLEHGKNINFISNENEMENVLKDMLQNPESIFKMERSAKLYAEKYVYPKAVITQIFEEVYKRKKI